MFVELSPTWLASLDEQARERASTLGRRAQEACAEWDLRLDGEPMYGTGAVVLPVVNDRGSALALKFGNPADSDAADEHRALTAWGGRGAVALHRADPRRHLLLLNRLSARDLTPVWDIEACELIAERYRLLHVPAGPPLARLSDRLLKWRPAVEALLRGAPVPRRMVEHALSLMTTFGADEACDGTMIHTDLHYANVLAELDPSGEPNEPEGMVTDRRRWVVIDPKPLSGDPHYEVAPLLWNRFDELAGDVRGGLRRRFEAVVDTAELDEDRARDWVIVRMLVNIAWTVEDLGGQRPDAQQKEWITRCLTVAKAVQ